MAFQGLHRIVVARQFRFGQRGVYFSVANVMQQDRGAPFAAFELGCQVMQALFDVGRYRAFTQRAYRVWHLLAPCFAIGQKLAGTARRERVAEHVLHRGKAIVKTALVIGAGPAGLMAAETLAAAGVRVTICDAKPSFGRKFLMAGKSGLNLTKDEPFTVLQQRFFAAQDNLSPMLAAFDAQAVQAWAQNLGQTLFTGSTGRVFPTVMKASPLLRAWLARLDELGVTKHTRYHWLGWQGDAAVFDTPEGRITLRSDVTVLALGGASWARLGSDGEWRETLCATGTVVAPFAPSNAALSVRWSHHMNPHLGAALKSVAWTAGALSSRGEAVVSARGLEGGGLYALTPALRDGADLYVDLIPDTSAKSLKDRLSAKSARLRLSHWLKNTLRLSPVKTALFFEMRAGNVPERRGWAESVKRVRIAHDGLRPLDEAISTAGGVTFDSLNSDLMLKARPGVFCAGEMLDWEAPTGGYLITACLATGRWAGLGALRYLA